MLASIIREAERAAARIAAHLVRPVVVAYRELYPDEDDRELFDPRSAVGGQFELPMFGFGKQGGSREASD